MSQLTGQEFNNKKGSQGSLLIWIWGQIYSYINNAIAAGMAAIDLSQYYTKSQTDTNIETAKQAVLSYLGTNYDTSGTVDTKLTTAINNLVNNAPTALNTLKALADQLALLGADENTISGQVAAILTTVEGKASQSSVDALTTSLQSTIASLNGKVDQSVYDAAVAAINTNISTLQTQIAGLASQSSVDALSASLGNKTDKATTTAVVTEINNALKTIAKSLNAITMYKTALLADFVIDTTARTMTFKNLSNYTLKGLSFIITDGLSLVPDASPTFSNNGDFYYTITNNVMVININPNIDFDFTNPVMKVLFKAAPSIDINSLTQLDVNAPNFGLDTFQA